MTSAWTRLAFLAPLGIALTACVSVLPEQPEPEAVYTIASPQTFARLQTNVVIREPDAPRLFASRKITSRSPDGGLKVVPNVAWADRTTRMLQVTLLEAFENDGPGLAVDEVTGVSGQYELYWRLAEFTLVGREGQCSLQLTLLDGRSREPIAQETVRATSLDTGKGDLARARALADAGRQCVEKAAEVVAREAVRPAPDDLDEISE